MLNCIVFIRLRYLGDDMLKKYKLYKSGKMLVTGAFITGVVALTSVSQVNADTVTETQDAQPKVALTSKASVESNLPSAKQNQANSVNTVATKEVSANAINATMSSTLPAQETLDSNTTNVQITPDKNSTSSTNASVAPVTSTTQQVDNSTKEISTPDITIQGHGQDYGWQKPMHENQTVGVTEQSKRLEAVKITVANADKTYQGDVIYQAHLAGTGWQQEVKNGELAGTVHQGRQMEAIKIRLTGELANRYNIYYRAYVQNSGWSDWVANGNIAGTTGLGLRLEALQFMLNLRHQPVTQNTKRTSVGATNLHFQVQGQDYGWQNTRKNDEIGGTTGQGRRLEAIKINIENNNLAGDLIYQAHLSGTGWQREVKNGELAGTVGQSRQMEAIKVNLTGELANYYNIYDTNKTVQWFFDRQGKLTYSMYGSRNGTDGTADCSGAVTQAIYDAGGTKPEYLYSTETLHDYLKQNDYKLIALNQEWYAKKGDIVIWGKQGQSIGAAGHVSIISTNDPDAKVVSVNYLSKGKKGTAVTEEDYNHFAKISGWPYTYVYRHISNL